MKLEVQREASGGSVELVEKSDVDAVELELCQSANCVTTTHRLVPCLFSVSEVYRRNVVGGMAKVNVAVHRRKVAVDQQKMSAICDYIKQTFDKFYNENMKGDRWISLINSKVNDRLGSLNRNFFELIDTHNGDGPQVARHKLGRDDQHLLKEYEAFRNDPD